MASASRPLKGLGSAWFPAALVALLLLAIPGFILFFLNVLGREGPVNAWLQDHYHLSYHIALPWWGGLILLLLPLAVMLLYFLKLKRKPLHVPSTFLWRKSIEDLHVNALIQWLRDNLLLLLQLLTLLFLIYSVMAFQLHGTYTSGQHYILMIDNSASMSATDVSPSRLERAKQEAIKEIDAHSDQDFGMVLVFNSEATTLQSYTNDRSILRLAIEHIEPTQRPTRFKDALDLADGLANPRRSVENEASRPAGEEAGKERTYATPEGKNTQVHLYSDGRFPDVPDFDLGNLNLHFHPIGEPGPDKVDNIGLVTLNANRDEKDPSKVLILAGVRNYRSKEANVKVRLRVEVNGTLMGVFEKLAQPQGADVDGVVVSVDRTAGKLKLRTGDQETRTLDLDKVRVRSMTGTDVDVSLLNAGHPVQVITEGQEVVELRVPALAGRTLTTTRDNKERETVLDRPGEGVVLFDLGNLDDRASVVLHADLPDIHDQFGLDNEAWLVLGLVRKAQVLVVGTPNKVLHAFFDEPATQKVCAVSYLSPSDLKDEAKYRRDARGGKYDLVVFDRCAPETVDDLPLSNTFFIDAVPPPWKRADMPKMATPHIKGWMTKDPLMRYLTALYEVGISEAFEFNMKDPRVPPRTPRLLESDKDATLMFSLAREPFHDLVMTFALINDNGEWVTNWPLLPSFPLFMRNVLYTLGNVSDATADETVQPGQVKVLRPDVAVNELQVADPAGHVETLLRGNRPDFSYGRTDQVGIYQVKWEPEGHRVFAVDLLDSDESNIQPREEFQVGGITIGAGQQRTQPHDTWKWVALGALGLLLLEWFVYNRRVFV